MESSLTTVSPWAPTPTPQKKKETGKLFSKDNLLTRSRKKAKKKAARGAEKLSKVRRAYFA